MAEFRKQIRAIYVGRGRKALHFDLTLTDCATQKRCSEEWLGSERRISIRISQDGTDRPTDRPSATGTGCTIAGESLGPEKKETPLATNFFPVSGRTRTYVDELNCTADLGKTNNENKGSWERVEMASSVGCVRQDLITGFLKIHNIT